MAQSAASSPAPSTRSSATSPAGDGGGLVTQHGKTTIADAVVSKIAGIAAREVHGVHELGGGPARALGSMRERVGGRSHAQGVSVEVGEREAAVDLDVVIDYGLSIADVAAGIRRSVISAIESMTGLSVTEVNINVDDVFMPSEDDEGDGQAEQSRVQ